MSEDQLQSTCFQWHWNTYPEQRRTIFHINQKARNAIEGNRMKAMGVVPGVSDMCNLLPGTVRWIEFKTETGVQSREQKEFQSLVTRLGMEYVIVRTFEQFKSLF
jgi:hypothetical protein